MSQAPPEHEENYVDASNVFTGETANEKTMETVAPATNNQLDGLYTDYITLSVDGLTCWGWARTIKDKPAVPFDGIVVDHRDKSNPIMHAFIRGRYVEKNPSASAVFQAYLEATANHAVGTKHTISIVMVMHSMNRPDRIEVDVLWLLAVATHLYFTSREQISWMQAIEDAVMYALHGSIDKPQSRRSIPAYFGQPIQEVNMQNTIAPAVVPLIRGKFYQFRLLSTYDAVRNTNLHNDNAPLNIWGLDFAMQIRSIHVRQHRGIYPLLVTLASNLFPSEKNYGTANALQTAMNADFDRMQFSTLSNVQWLNLVFESILANVTLPPALVKLANNGSSFFKQ